MNVRCCPRQLSTQDLGPRSESRVSTGSDKERECAAGVPASLHSQSSHVRSRSLHLLPDRSPKLALRWSVFLQLLSSKHWLQINDVDLLTLLVTPGMCSPLFAPFSGLLTLQSWSKLKRSTSGVPFMAFACGVPKRTGQLLSSSSISQRASNREAPVFEVSERIDSMVDAA